MSPKIYLGQRPAANGEFLEESRVVKNIGDLCVAHTFLINDDGINGNNM